MPTVYWRDDTGAPVPPDIGSTASYRFPALKHIIKTCLVYGYGSKSAAGWELIAEGGAYLILRSGSHSGYVCFSKVSDTIVRVYVAATYAGVSNDVIVGEGVRSGPSAGSNPPQVLDIDSLVYHTNTFSWSIVADERTAVITWYAFAATTPSAETGSGSLDGFTLYFGEDSNSNFMALGGNASTTTTATSNQFNSASITLLRDPVTGLLIDSGSYSGYYGVLDESLTVNVNQSRIIETLELGKVHWYAPANKECGYLRGVALVAGLRVLSPAYAARSLGIDLSNFSSRTGATPLTVVDGVQLIVAKASSGSSRFLLTDAPAFWGEGA